MSTINEEYEYFRAVKNEQESRGKKTDVVDLINTSSGAKLGQVRWFPQWRQYCFFPERDCVFSKGCLKDVNNLIGELEEMRTSEGE